MRFRGTALERFRVLEKMSSYCAIGTGKIIFSILWYRDTERHTS